MIMESTRSGKYLQGVKKNLVMGEDILEVKIHRRGVSTKLIEWSWAIIP
jgi:hypothetical protein